LALLKTALFFICFVEFWRIVLYIDDMKNNEVKKQRGKQLKRPNPNSLPYFVALAVVVALVVGGALFYGMYQLFYDPEQNNLYDVTRTVIATLAALTVGGAAIIQYRKHKIAEIDLIDRQAANADKRAADAESRDAKLSERLSMAIEHLGNKDNTSIRVGALYELRRLAEDSPRDRASVQEIVTLFLNEQRGEIDKLSHIYQSAEEVPRDEDGKIAYAKLPRLPSDITVALGVLFFYLRIIKKNIMKTARSRGII
jgi:hypothetical protein